MYLMHRISHEVKTSIKLLNDDNMLSIGWQIIVKEGLANETIQQAQGEKADFIDYFEGLKNKLNNKYFTRRKGYYLYNFLKLDKGDKVVIPMPIEGTITIVEVVDKPIPYRKEANGEEVDIGFVVNVRKIAENIQRADYVIPELASKFKYRGSNLVLSSKDNTIIDSLISNFKKGKKSHSFDNHRENIISIINQYLNDNVNDNQFEKIIEMYFEKIGADSTYRRSKKYKNEKNEKIADVDVIAKFDALRTVVYVQVKHHKGFTNNHGLEQLHKFEHENEEDFKHLNPLKWLITTGEVDSKTEDKSVEYNIRIISDREFAAMMYSAGMIEIPKL